jgi:hypothetical protein
MPEAVKGDQFAKLRAAGVLRETPMTIFEAAAKGGRSRSEAKLAASRRNLERAKAAKEARRRADARLTTA